MRRARCRWPLHSCNILVTGETPRRPPAPGGETEAAHRHSSSACLVSISACAKGHCRRCISVIFEDTATTEPPCLRAGGARASSRASEGLGAGRWPDWFLRGAHSWHKRKRYWPLAAARLSSAHVPAASAHALLLHSYRGGPVTTGQHYLAEQGTTLNTTSSPCRAPHSSAGGARRPQSSPSLRGWPPLLQPLRHEERAVSQRGCPGGCHGE